MKNSLKIFMVAFLMLSFIACDAQIKNAKTATVKISGNCGMCKSTIEKAGNLKKVANVDWNKETKTAEITFDSKKTNQDEILKRIALAGYDNEKFLAPNDVYDNLHGCCQYNRESKEVVKEEKHHSEEKTIQQEDGKLTTVFEKYFILKDALVMSDVSKSTTISNELIAAINAVDMKVLANDVHMVWMKKRNAIEETTKAISSSKDIDNQRKQFITLSNDIYDIIKVSKFQSPIYIQHCPMANNGKGANWLSKESTVKNPYYGSKMLSCGKVVETIK